MDEQLKRELQEALYGALAAIYKENTKDNVDKGYDDQKIEIIVSGDSLSLIKSISEDNTLDNKISSVADSFSLLNNQLKTFEEMRVMGPEGSFTNFVNFISAMASIPNIENLKKFSRDDAVNMSNYIGEVVKALDMLKSTDIEKRLTDKNVNRIKNVFTKIASIFDDETIKSVFFENPGNEMQGKGIQGIIALLNFVTQEGFFMKMMRAKLALDLGGAKAIKEFMLTIGSIFNDEIIKNAEFDKFAGETRVKGLQAAITLLDKISNIGFVLKVVFASRMLNEKRGKKLASFFTGFITDLTTDISNKKLELSSKIIDSMSKLFDSLTKLALGIGLVSLIIAETSPLTTMIILFAVIKGIGKLLDEIAESTKKIDPKDLSKFSEFVDSMMMTVMKGILGLVLAAYVIQEVSAGDLVWTLGFMVVVVAGIVALSIFASKFDEKGLEGAKQISNMMLALSGAMFILSLTAIAISEVGWVDLLLTTVLYAAIVAAGIFIAKYLGDNADTLTKGIKASEQFIDMFKNIAGVVLIIGATALLSRLVEWEDLVKVGAIILAATGVVYLINKFVENHENIKDNIKLFSESVAALSVSLLMIGITSMIAKNIQWESLGVLGLIIMSTIGVLLIMKWIMKENGEEILEGMRTFTAAVLGLTMSLLLVAITTTIAATMSWDSMILLGLFVAGAIGILYLIKLFSGKGMPISDDNIKNILLMQLCILGIGLNILILAGLVSVLKNADISLSDVGLLMMIVLGEVLVIGILALINMIPGVENSVKGLVYLIAVMIGLELNILLLYGVAEVLNRAADKAGGLWNLFENITYILMGELAIIGILALISRIIDDKKTLKMAAIVAMLAALVGIVHYTAYVAKKANEVTESEILWVGGILAQLVAVATALGALGYAASIGLAALAAVEALLLGLVFVVDKFVSLIIKWRKAQLEYGSLQDIGKEIGTAFGNFLKELGSGAATWGTLIAIISGIFTGPLYGLMIVLGKFVKIVEKVATMNMLVGYDEKGNPIYERVDPAVFGYAAKMISGGFSTFIKELGAGLRSLGGDGSGFFGTIKQAVVGGLVLETINMISSIMNPIMQSVGTFVDAIMKLATGTYKITDEDGNERIERVKPEDFVAGANVVIVSFREFIKALGEGAKGLDDDTCDTIESLADSMVPLMEAVGKYVDAIMTFSKGTYKITEIIDGKPVNKTVHVSIDDFTAAANNITTNFISFINTLSTNTAGMKRAQRKAIESLSESMLPLMESVGEFVEAIVKMATGTITIDNGDGVKKTLPLKTSYYQSAANVITDAFMSFINKMDENLKNLNDDTLDVLEDLEDTIGPLMKGLSSFADSILKLATGKYIDGYDENGNPKYLTVTSAMYTNAANTLVSSFNMFITGLRDGLNGISEEARDVIEDLSKGGIKDLMESLSTFTKVISSNLFIIDGYDEKGNPIYMRDESGNPIPIGDHFQRVAKSIALAISSFILNINVNFKKIEKDIPGTIDKLKSVLKVVSPIKGWLSAMKEFDMNTDYNAITDTLYGSINHFASVFAGSIFEGFSSKEKEKDLKTFKSNAKLLLDGAETIGKIAKIDFEKVSLETSTMIVMLKDLMEIEVPAAALKYEDAIRTYIQNYGYLADEVVRVTRTMTSASLQGTMVLSQLVYNLLFEGPGNFDSTLVRFLLELNKFDSGVSISIRNAKRFGDQFEESIDKIEKSLKKNEKDRNKMLTDLTKHLDTIGTKLQVISKGLNEISKSSMDNVQKLAEEFAKMQTEMIQSVMNAGGFNTTQPADTTQPAQNTQPQDNSSTYNNFNNQNGNDTPSYFGGKAVEFVFKEAYPGLLRGIMKTEE